MRKITATIIFFFFLAQTLIIAQVLPKESAVLNYRRIGFSWPEPGTFVKCKVEIAVGYYSVEDSFKKHICSSAYSRTNNLITEVSSFDQYYTWRVITSHKNSTVSKSELHHFKTGYVPTIDTCNIRLRILKSAVKYKDDYVFIDGNNALYDMKGNPVWYLPAEQNKAKGNVLIRDLKMTPQATITFLLNQHAYEVDYNGDTLWRGPDNGEVSGSDSERYHHELTRLSNGHYMVLGTEHVLWDHKINPVDTSFSLNEDDAGKTDSTRLATVRKTPFGTIIEYDSQGHLVWSWKSSKYFMGSDVVNYRPEGKVRVIDVHENAFYFDERDSMIYISYRNISRILKIKYPEGNIVNTYGEIFKPGVAPAGNGLFCAQHGIRRSKDGYLYLYNNNACNDDNELPKVVMMKESPDGKDSLIKVWEYECTDDGVNVRPIMKKAIEKRKLMAKKKQDTGSWKGTLLHVTTGGNVIEMPDHSLFVCTNAQLSKIFIISRDKKILWSAIPEKWNPGDNKWYITINQYRASIITRNELDKLIYNSMKKQENK